MEPVASAPSFEKGVRSTVSEEQTSALKTYLALDLLRFSSPWLPVVTKWQFS